MRLYSEAQGRVGHKPSAIERIKSIFHRALGEILSLDPVLFYADKRISTYTLKLPSNFRERGRENEREKESELVPSPDTSTRR